MTSSMDVITTVLPAIALEQVIGAPQSEVHPLRLLASSLHQLLGNDEKSNYLPLTAGGGTAIFTTLKMVTAISRKLPRPLGWALDTALLYLILGPGRIAKMAENIKTVLSQRNREAELGWVHGSHPIEGYPLSTNGCWRMPCSSR